MIGVTIAQLLQVSSVISSRGTYSFATAVSSTHPTQAHTLASLFLGNRCRVSVKELQFILWLLEPFAPGDLKMP
jgi:hypothetical protein